jgi:hypothetical protein
MRAEAIFLLGIGMWDTGTRKQGMALRGSLLSLVPSIYGHAIVVEWFGKYLM